MPRPGCSAKTVPCRSRRQPRRKPRTPEQPASLGLAAAAGENAPPFAVPRWAPQRWVALVAAAAVGAAAGILLDRDAARRSVPSPVRVSEPTLDAVPPLPEVHAAPAPGKDSRAPGRERVAPPPSVPVSDPAPRPVRKLHRRAAAAADATAAAPAKLQAGGESLK